MERPTLPHLPLEVWWHIAEFCSVYSLKSLTLVSKDLNSIASSILFHTISVVAGAQTSAHANETTQKGKELSRVSSEGLNTWAFDADKLQWALTQSDGLRRHLRRAYVFPGHDTVTLARLLDKIEHLQFLHVSMKDVYRSFPFSLARVTSLSVMEYGGFPNRYEHIFQLFQIPTLREMHLEFRRQEGIPESYRKPGCSNVTRLTLRTPKFRLQVFAPMLAWPRDLQSLAIDVWLPLPAQPRTPGAGMHCNQDFNNLYRAFRRVPNLQHSLRHFDYRYGLQGARSRSFEACGTALQSFTHLQTVDIPLELCLEFTDFQPFCIPHSARGERGVVPPKGWAPPPQTRLPKSLRQLCLLLDVDRHLEEEKLLARRVPAEEPLVEARYVRRGAELAEWLNHFIRLETTTASNDGSGGMWRKVEEFPHLERITICQSRGILLRESQSAVPYLEMKDSKVITEIFASAGIQLCFTTWTSSCELIDVDLVRV
jgi:hypothetical protein